MKMASNISSSKTEENQGKRKQKWNQMKNRFKAFYSFSKFFIILF
jgi:hypothetical protein